MAEIARFSPQEVQAYEDSLKVYRDLKNSFDTAREEGREVGREEGIEIVLQVMNLAKQRKNVDEISKQVGIAKDRVIEILRNINEVS